MVYFILLISSIGWGQDCDENMFWSDCGSPYECLPTCSDPYYEPETCIEICEIGCFCNPGYVYHDNSYSFCVPIENCIEIPPCNNDINFDGVVDILDVVLLLNCILLYDSCNEYSDINGDGTTNVLDVVSLVNIIIN